MPKQYRSPLMASIHETAEGLHTAGAMDKRTMRDFDDLCRTPVLTPRRKSPGPSSAGGHQQGAFRRPRRKT
jgi:putative transcriptional regulator